MKFLSLAISAILLGIDIAGLDPRTQAQSQCRLESRNFPETFIQIRGAKDASYYEGTLFHRGEPIRRLWFTQSNGYGSKWWGYEKEDGRGGRLLEFRGNHPARSFARPVDPDAVRQNLRQFILVGLGADLYYTQEETHDGHRFPWREDGFELIKAVEGYFATEEGCEEFLNR